MKLYEELLIKILNDAGVEVLFPELNLEEVLKDSCYRALSQIKHIIENDTYLDEDCVREVKTCFDKIEGIVVVFEKFGSDGGSRHDF